MNRQDMTPRERWEHDVATVRQQWAGRVFRCKDTGLTTIIPDNVMPKDFFVVGEGFVDVGDGMYSRAGGNIEEITQNASEDIQND